jgi:hypothetical protein
VYTSHRVAFVPYIRRFVTRVVAQSLWPLKHTNNNNNKHPYAGQLNSFTRLRALLVLHDRGVLGPVNKRR